MAWEARGMTDAPPLVPREAFEEAHRVLEQGNGAAPEAEAFNILKRRDRRPCVKFKGPEFGLEFRALIHKAAERQGMTQAAFVSSVLVKEAERIIRGDDSTAQPPPALPTVVVNPRSVAEDARLARIEAALQLLTTPRRRWWQFR
jgi:hypothetical protein